MLWLTQTGIFMNKTQLQALIAKEYKSHKRFFSNKSAFVKELEQFLASVPNNSDFNAEILNVLQSILKCYEELPLDSQSFKLRLAIVDGLAVLKLVKIKPIDFVLLSPIISNDKFKLSEPAVANPIAYFGGMFEESARPDPFSDFATNFNPERQFEFYDYNAFYGRNVDIKFEKPQNQPVITFSRDEDSLSRELRALSDEHSVPVLDSVFLGTNEVDTAKSAEFLSSIPNQLGGCHIGFSGWHNFDIMVMRQSRLGVICDINPRNTLFLEAMLGLVRTAENCQDFINKAIEYIHITDKLFKFSPNINDQDEFYKQIESLSDEVEAELRRPSSWLYEESRFEYIKKLALADKIALVTRDIRHTQQFEQLCKLLGEHQVPIDTVYVSNIFGWQKKEADKKQFIESLKVLTARDDTVLICATMVDSNLNQIAIKCADLDKENPESQLSLTESTVPRLK